MLTIAGGIVLAVFILLAIAIALPYIWMTLLLVWEFAKFIVSLPGRFWDKVLEYEKPITRGQLMLVLKWAVFAVGLVAAIAGDLWFAGVLFALWFIADVYQRHEKRHKSRTEY